MSVPCKVANQLCRPTTDVYAQLSTFLSDLYVSPFRATDPKIARRRKRSLRSGKDMLNNDILNSDFECRSKSHSYFFFQIALKTITIFSKVAQTRQANFIFHFCIFRFLIFMSLIFRSLSFRSLIFRSLIFRSLIFRSLIFKFLIFVLN